MTAEQLEASRAERLRLNGSGALTFEDARTWLEETGLCLFLPRKQSGSAPAPSFVEAVAGQTNSSPDAKHIALAEDLLVRLEQADVAVRLNLLGQPGERPDFVVAAWVLPYVYALRGDRDWRRIPQLTGSRQVSPLAVHVYKLLETGESTISRLRNALGREVTESAVLRAVTELWQQLRIIPITEAPGKAPRWQLLRVRFQKAIAEGASTSQVTAISVLASIYLQAVIAGTMEDVEMFLAPLTARSKVREVLRGLVATRQVHTLALGHAPHFYVAGTLPEFVQTPTVYASASAPAASYFRHSYEREEEIRRPSISIAASSNSAPPAAHAASETTNGHHAPASRKVTPAPKPTARPHFSRPAVQARDRKPAQSANSRTARHVPSESRGPRWSSNAAKHSARSSSHGPARRNGAHSAAKPASRTHGNAGARPNGTGTRKIKAAAPHTKRAVAAGSRRRPVAAAGSSSTRRSGYSAQGAKKRG